MNNTLDEMQKPMSALLPLSLEKVMQSYQDFAWQNTPDDPKEYTAFHNACKASLSHMESLFRLSRIAMAQPAAASLPQDELDAAHVELSGMEGDFTI